MATEVLSQERALEIIAPVQLRDMTSLIEFYYFIGMEYDEFEQIIDRITTSDDERSDGRININSAPEEVLLCLPQLEQSDVDKLIQARSKEDAELDSILWITTVLDEEKATAIGSYITVKSSQYSEDIVAVSADGRAFCRYYGVIDTAEGTPTIVYKQSLHQFGWPLAPDILDALREGEEISS